MPSVDPIIKLKLTNFLSCNIRIKICNSVNNEITTLTNNYVSKKLLSLIMSDT